MTHRTPDQWRQIIDEQSNSQLSQERFCKDKGISYGTFQTWRKKLTRPTNLAQNFVEIPRPTAAEANIPPLDQGLRVRLELGAGVVLELTRV
jgi:hypothetical protein